MQPGALDRLIVIEEEVKTKDSVTGQTKSTWTYVGKFWAHLRAPRTESEEDWAFTAKREIPLEKYIFTIRFFSGLTVKHRLTYDDKYFDIVSLKEVGRRQWLQIMGVFKEGRPV